MDERVRISLWMVGGSGLGVLLGGAFGALTGALYWKSGRSAGTRFGHAVADSFARAAGREPSRVRRGMMAGAADGILFLGALGTAGGILTAVIHPAGQEPPAGSLLLAALLLVAGAAFFGLLAYAMVRSGFWAVLGVFAGGLVGSLGAIGGLGPDYFLLGVLPGVLAGLLLSFVGRRYAPEFRPPHVDLARPRQRPGPDSIQGAGPFEEG